VSALSTAVLLAAEVTPDESTVRPGPIAFLIFIGLAVATFFLWRSMNKQLKKVPPTFDGDDGAGSATSPESPADGSTGPVDPSVNGSNPPKPSSSS
jgi:hypothetical protein